MLLINNNSKIFERLSISITFSYLQKELRDRHTMFTVDLPYRNGSLMNLNVFIFTVYDE